MSESATGTKDVEELNSSPAIDEERTDPADEGRRNAVFVTKDSQGYTLSFKTLQYIFEEKMY